ncbi:LexA family transcriptional regulator [Agrobacterium sp. 22-3674b3]|uniref:LexA family transcriptional regulator n=1 Tax=Agrobacterium TaxID=357 RepID=UPI000695A96F|nr:S24 family peptidase [Agrobacterium tumefaciens]WCK73153.1 helix-turn-helix transcriptional regulator [Agrobacterium tumefaciens]
MNKLQEIAIERLKELGLGPVEAAVKAGIERTFVRDLVDGKKSTVTLKKIPDLAKALQLDADALIRGEVVPFDDPDEAVTPTATKPNASFPPRFQKFDGDGYVPLLGQSIGGPNGRFILNGSEVGRLFVPPMLEGVEGAYAVRVYGTSMEPRFKAGETVWINPNEPVRAGDDVIVQVVTDEENQRESYIKEFRSQSSKVTRLWQHNPEEGETNEVTFASSTVFSVHKIVFHATV